MIPAPFQEFGMSEASSPLDCIFCRIIAGDIPCCKIFENEDILCFLDIGPVVAGHTLVIPKRHFRNVFDMPADIGAILGSQLPRLARAVCAAVAAPACHILLNNGIEAMQSVHHAHYHIIPRQTGDGFFVPWNPGKLELGEAKRLISAIQHQYACA
jgi:histidine triad (HIT) family protein